MRCSTIVVHVLVGCWNGDGGWRRTSGWWETVVDDDFICVIDTLFVSHVFTILILGHVSAIANRKMGKKSTQQVLDASEDSNDHSLLVYDCVLGALPVRKTIYVIQQNSEQTSPPKGRGKTGTRPYMNRCSHALTHKVCVYVL